AQDDVDPVRQGGSRQALLGTAKTDCGGIRVAEQQANTYPDSGFLDQHIRDIGSTVEETLSRVHEDIEPFLCVVDYLGPQCVGNASPARVEANQFRVRRLVRHRVLVELWPQIRFVAAQEGSGFPAMI